MIGAVERIAAPRPNVAQGVGFVNRGLTLARTGFDLTLRVYRGNPVAAATAVRQSVFSLIEIATSLRSSQ